MHVRQELQETALAKTWGGTSGNEFGFQIPGARLLKSQVRDDSGSEGDAEKKGHGSRYGAWLQSQLFRRALGKSLGSG